MRETIPIVSERAVRARLAAKLSTKLGHVMPNKNFLSASLLLLARYCACADFSWTARAAGRASTTVVRAAYGTRLNDVGHPGGRRSCPNLQVVEDFLQVGARNARARSRESAANARRSCAGWLARRPGPRSYEADARGQARLLRARAATRPRARSRRAAASFDISPHTPSRTAQA